MLISYHGGACVKLVVKTRSGDAVIVIDPYPTKSGQFKGEPTVAVFSHGSPAKMTKDTIVIADPGEYEIRGNMIYGIPVAHAKLPQATITRIDAEGLTVIHAGALDHAPSEIEQEPLGKIDILILPVGGTSGSGSLTPAQAEEMLTELEPRIVIPIAYRSAATPEFEPLEKFLKIAGLTSEKMDKLKISKKELPAEETKLVVIEETG